MFTSHKSKQPTQSSEDSSESVGTPSRILLARFFFPRALSTWYLTRTARVVLEYNFDKHKFTDQQLDEWDPETTVSYGHPPIIAEFKEQEQTDQ